MKRLGGVFLGVGLLLGGPAGAGLNQWTSSGPGAAVNAVAAHPSVAARLYVAAADGVYRSPDGGLSWENTRGPLLGRNALCLTVAPDDGNLLYAGASAGLYLSRDAGSRWTRATQPGAGVLSLAAGVEGRVWAGTFGQGVYLSRDAGSTWSTGAGMAEAIVFALAADLGNSELVYAGTAAGLYFSRDGGLTWALGGGALQGLSVRAIQVLPGTGQLLVGTFGQGIFFSGDGGQTWAARNQGLEDLQVRGLSFEPGADPVWDAATSSKGFFRSGDQGQVWRALNAGLPGLGARSVLAHPTLTGRVLGGGPGSGVWIIDQGGQPRLEVDRLPLDLGEVAVGGQRALILRLVNTGKAVLRLSRLSVGRTPPFAVSPATLELAPGAEVSAEVRFTPQQRGSQQDTLRLRSDDPDAGLVAIPLRGSGVEAELSLSPASLDFGQVRLSGFRDTTVVLSNTGNTALTLRGASFDSSAFAVMGFSPRQLGAGQRLALGVRFRPSRIGPIAGRLTLLSDAGRNPRAEAVVGGPALPRCWRRARRAWTSGPATCSGPAA